MVDRPRAELSEAFGKPEWDYSERHQHAVKEYVAYLNDRRLAEKQKQEIPPHPDFSQFSEEEVMYIVDQAQRQVDEPFDAREFRNAMKKTLPVISMPKLSNFLHDLYYALAQPEMLQLFWPHWNPRNEGTRGPKAGHLGTKALLAMSVFLGKSAHLLQNHGSLASNAPMQRIFAWVETQALAHVDPLAATRAKTSFFLAGYKTMLKHIPKLSDPKMWELAMRVNIVMVRAIHKLKGVTTLRLLIDGTDVAAWCEQVGKKDPVKDAKLRARLPRAAARAYSETIRNDAGELEKRYKKFWRGYYLVALVDQATGRPLVWTLRNGDWDEAKALQELLFLLYEYWPDAPVSMIVGDAAWNEPWAYKLCADHGIDLIARRSKHSLSGQIVEISESASKRIAAVDRKGVAYCRRHNDWLNKDKSKRYTHPMTYAGVDRTTGRVRYVCNHGPNPCGKLGISKGVPGLGGDGVSPLLSWQLFTYYPTTMEGRPDLHAMRVAMLARRNQVESLFSSLKVGSKLGLQGPSRTRIIDFNSVRMMISLSFLMKTAFMLAAARIAAGEFDRRLPAELADELEDLGMAA
jgi:hypothetical protein